MSKPSLEQQRIESLERALEVAMYWLLRAELATPDSSILVTTRDLKTSLDMFLRNHGIPPRSKEAYALLKRPMEAYHHELEKAVKRATR